MGRLNRLLTTWCCVVGLIALTSTIAETQGPPDHAGGGDPKTISECQIIDELGPYVVINNLPGPGGLLTGAEADWVDPGDCIAIDSENVAMDGQGFLMTGDGSDDGAGDGVRINSAGGVSEYIEIRNLNITGFERAVDLEGAFFSVIENVSALSSANHGITIHSGQSNRVVNNNSIGNGVAGIRVSLRSIVSNNITNGNGGVGLFADRGSILTGNTSNLNDGDGIAVTCPGLVESNVAIENGQIAGDNLDLNEAGGDCVTVNNVAP